jgi:hypothetical protein
MSGTPSLEFARKEAKALLKQVRALDPEGVRRIQLTHPIALRDREPNELQLADVQHVIAREHGFASWPRLVDYFEEMHRHTRGPRSSVHWETLEHFEASARSVTRRHQRGDPMVARELAHFVPRFYGRPSAEILATAITDDEARLVVARENRRTSWEELVERASDSRAWHDRLQWQSKSAPFERARHAIRDHDVDALAAILDEHPELLTPSLVDREWRQTLGFLAISFEYTAKTAEARQVTDFLASRGVDIQRELDERLLGFSADRPTGSRQVQADRIRWFLDRGANPNWMPPNGISVLEHALVRYHNGACVDLIAERVTPRRALWIAAGLGDVAGVRSFIAGNAALTPEGRLNRPDTLAMDAFPRGLPPNYDADDLEIMWEAFQIAGWNGRWAAMDALLDTGLPVDYAPSVGWPLMLEAAGNMHLDLAEYLVRRGADLDREWPPHGSARGFARMHFGNWPQKEETRRLLAICDAGNPEDILAELDANRPSPPPLESRTSRMLQLAADDAARQHQSVVTTENMLVGLLRFEGGIFASFFMGTGADMQKLRATIGARLLPDADPLSGQELQRNTDAEAALEMAIAEADARRRESVDPIALLVAMLSQPEGAASRLLTSVGTDSSTTRERLSTLL